MIIRRPSHLKGSIPLPASKSESNRLLLMNALSGNRMKLFNLSDADDTRIMKELLDTCGKSRDGFITLNAGDAGTVYRFITACLAQREGTHLLVGSERMHRRPVRFLVDALRSCGAEIEYMGAEGFPPLRITGRPLRSVPLSVRADVSSQYISALMMIAPLLPNGLDITLEGNVSSRPYIVMTAALMEEAGITVKMEGNLVAVGPGFYREGKYTAGNDWSAASYWYAHAACAPEAGLFLPGLMQDSVQGDSFLDELMVSWGVESEFSPEGVHLRNNGNGKPYEKMDFSQHPDLAPALIVLAAVKGAHTVFTGLESLKIKECDRMQALQTELDKAGHLFMEEGDAWILDPYHRPVPRDTASFQTYGDHRMAMAFSLFCWQFDQVEIQDPEVVKKSYPSFWEAMRQAGFSTESMASGRQI